LVPYLSSLALSPSCYIFKSKFGFFTIENDVSTQFEESNVVG